MAPKASKESENLLCTAACNLYELPSLIPFLPIAPTQQGVCVLYLILFFLPGTLQQVNSDMLSE